MNSSPGRIEKIVPKLCTVELRAVLPLPVFEETCRRRVRANPALAADCVFTLVEGGCAMNWTDALTEEARRDCLLRTDALVCKYGLSESVVRNALRRYGSRGLVERVSTKIYINHFNQQFLPRDLVNALRSRSYISLESALVERGVTTQNPSVLTCVTPDYPQTFRSKSVTIVYRKISPQLY